jgi:hypothetical protein
VDVVGGFPLGVGLHVHELDREGRALDPVGVPDAGIV